MSFHPGRGTLVQLLPAPAALSSVEPLSRTSPRAPGICQLAGASGSKEAPHFQTVHVGTSFPRNRCPSKGSQDGKAPPIPASPTQGCPSPQPPAGLQEEPGCSKDKVKPGSDPHTTRHLRCKGAGWAGPSTDKPQSPLAGGLGTAHLPLPGRLRGLPKQPTVLFLQVRKPRPGHRRSATATHKRGEPKGCHRRNPLGWWVCVAQARRVAPGESTRQK